MILPGCDDRNRGDQALIWETVDLAQKAGYSGKFLMLADKKESMQSRKIGIGNVRPILEHPSKKFKNLDNTQYTLGLKIRWGIASIWDLITKEPLTHRCMRSLFKNLYRKSVKDSLKEFEETGACFVKGGGFLHAYGGLAETYKIYYFLYHIRLALSLGKTVYVLPNSFGPFNGLFVKRMIGKTLSKCKVVMSREKISQDQLKKECSVDSFLFADIAFHLEPDKAFDANSELRKQGIPVGEKTCVAITARPYRFTGHAHPEVLYENYKRSLIQATQWLSDNGFFPVFVEHVYDERSHENDITCISEVVSGLKKECQYAVFSNRDLTCAQLKKIYGEFNYIIGTRFHSVIFSLALGVPAIAITYGGNKGVGIMKDLDLEKYSVSIDSVTGEEIIKKFHDLTLKRNEKLKSISENLILFEKEKETITQLLREV